MDRDSQVRGNGPADRASLLFLAAIGLACWISVTLFMAALGFDWKVGDPWNSYWQPSGELVADPSLLFAVAHKDHVPGYIYLLALLRSVLSSVGPEMMQAIGGMAWIGNIGIVYLILRQLDVAPGPARLGALAYGIFPFTGLTYSVFPLADPLALLAMATGVLFYLQDRRWPMAIALGLAVLLHKFAWPVVALMVLIGLWQRRIKLRHAVVIVAPLMIYCVGVAIHFGDATRLIGGNISHGVVSKRTFVVADGILGSLASGNPKDIIKGGITGLIALVAAVLSLSPVTRRTPVLLALVLPVALFGLVTNENLVWGLCRFGKLIIIPLFARLGGVTPTPRLVRTIQILLILAFLTQLAFAAYIVHFYRVHTY